MIDLYCDEDWEVEYEDKPLIELCACAFAQSRQCDKINCILMPKDGLESPAASTFDPVPLCIMGFEHGNEEPFDKKEFIGLFR